MGVFDSIFGGAKHDKKVDGLFQESNKIDKSLLVRERTVLKRPAEHEDSSSEHELSEEESEEPAEKPVNKQKKPKTSQDENYDLEAKYFDKLLKEDVKKDEAPVEESDSESEKSDPEADKADKKLKKARVVDLKESELAKAERTVFVGNVPLEAIKNKIVYKQFKQLFAKIGKVQSIRFRSISFGEALPRKIAFVHQLFHDSRQNANAYVVFETKEASLKAVESLNARIFEDFHLKVDHVTHPTPKDNKRTVFVGNLDFEAQEESLWKYFNKHTNNDVESVRIVRDSKTNLGKGFALVQFRDTLSVNKVLLLNDKPMDEGKSRKLRITRAKKNAKPSVLSPNHVDNIKKPRDKNLEKLNEKQRTKLGRVKALGKADRSTAGSTKVILEGERAKKSGNTKVKKPRHKKPRIRDRSTKYKEQLKAQKK